MVLDRKQQSNGAGTLAVLAAMRAKILEISSRAKEFQMTLSLLTRPTALVYGRAPG